MSVSQSTGSAVPADKTVLPQILVIKLSALGDFVQALGPCAAIRAHHPMARITLLTTPAFVPLGRLSPYFDEVWSDRRPKLTQPWAIWALARQLRQGRFDRVYDLQTSDRSGLYFRLMRRRNGGPEWSGIAPGCSHPHANPDRDPMHTLARQAEQLSMAGIPKTPFPVLDWVPADLSHLSEFALTAEGETRPERPLVLLVPGGAAHRPDKRWPADRYGALARRLTDQGYQIGLIGTEAERDALDRISTICPGAWDFSNRTSIVDLAALGRRAHLAIGNDTGPMHVFAVSGCPSVVLYSQASDPTRCGQRGPAVEIIRVSDLNDLAMDDVLAATAGVMTVRSA